MKLISCKITVNELKKMAQEQFGDFVKAVVDVEKEIMVVDSGMHADEEKLLLDQGSSQNNLWGINLYPDFNNREWIEFDSMINLRPSFGNTTRGVESKDVRDKIISIVNKLVEKE
ncbi:hypothetical protein COS81_03025 [candidate division WWE3 bacterium CG06_land_8_20_14_3_00_42_16]|uniref:Uncharacterized protein n=3 Tax=Katanobacteria TaxID=422282 RepID=A0A2M7AMT2_UNCKA|nr:MAG: hypothetical protein AUJ38_00645 [bacterium CG1_02_42_9]PIU68685.1 MAG: hypothetical protein COS81_03025 [candidate division WWE3 bacterium CG06_land_8_20_14_3_00_42_16]PJA37202.1 MAG: hypothetical protein CO181_04495 [candidate division WWE3 bacterium CG_4_9_14_3_um_filter_43_9]PJC68253.1 MAG: hypothetical protein CO015_04710 [candidate division WWE3 bacterium CG_4_8_14_3_um_filter_42_11]